MRCLIDCRKPECALQEKVFIGFANSSNAGRARRGPTLAECVLMHAVARLALHPLLTNVQASWVKMGPEQAARLLAVGCNDMGGSIMNESITRAAGKSSRHFQCPSFHRCLTFEVQVCQMAIFPGSPPCRCRA